MKRAFLVLLMLLSLGVGAALAGPCPAQFPTSRGNGTVAGVPVAGGTQYYFKDTLLNGFDCFEELSSWFPSYITSSNATNPAKQTVDMAYTTDGTATFSNVVVPTAGTYTLTIRYAFATGLFPGVLARPEGIKVNGTVMTVDLNFPVTGDFDTFSTVTIAVPLNAGQNTVQVFNVATQSISRLDSMTVTAGGSNSCSVLPQAPGGFSAAEDSNNAIALTWNASTTPAGCTVGYYNVFRGTTSGFIPSAANQVATVVSGTKYKDTTGMCQTPYYYVVQAVDLAGLSVTSTQASASISQCPTVSSAQINAGGSAVAPFISDVDFEGGSILSHKNVIDLSGVTNAAPMTVYQDARQGNFTYTLAGFVPGSSHTVRLHFAETYFSTVGSRTFNISINGTQVMTNFDIFAAAGAKNKAVIQELTGNADSSGTFVVTFTSVVNNSLLSAIEIN
ncbi:malectin domain-containing carbohydrate-binding protein [Edaphobacter modestus]|uniref:Carbohydrate binding protein with CBM6 domain n=1 Tax=Edaphobacter modestus TaxID=388466 RepID=A0A4Q7Y1S1_9BACT|nr:malectin domain-containing carbohydrate-binding protein [Edaphobacter modestus]RZU29579.1 carbohydrate binding protein with CBM6 domain [Edaphobacter modestus]